MTNSNHISWARLAAEGGAIVVSILLAFWIDAWWDTRKEQISLHEDLLTLEQEISQNLDHIELRLGNISTVFEKLDYAFGVLANPDTQDLPDNFFEDLNLVYSIWGTDETRNAFDVVLGSDNLRLIENPDLRKSIADSSESIEDFKEQYKRLYGEYAENQAPYFVRNFVVSDFGWYEGEEFYELYDYRPLAEWGMLNSVPASRFTTDTQAVNSREFWNMLYVWRGFYVDYTYALLEAQEQNKHTLELLESELGKHR